MQLTIRELRSTQLKNQDLFCCQLVFFVIRSNSVENDLKFQKTEAFLLLYSVRSIELLIFQRPCEFHNNRYFLIF